MRTDNDKFGKFKDETGEEYYCPLGAAKSSRIDAEWALDNCVEASTAGRYSGNLNVADRFNT
jgi:hypothetical protein